MSDPCAWALAGGRRLRSPNSPIPAWADSIYTGRGIARYYERMKSPEQWIPPPAQLAGSDSLCIFGSPNLAPCLYSRAANLLHAQATYLPL
jgi:hypothetical protein